MQATIRHRTQGGRSSPSKDKVIGAKNTSWALVTMKTAEAVKAALSADEVKAGSEPLVLNRFSAEQAEASTGAMKQVGLTAKERIQARRDLKMKQQRALAKVQTMSRMSLAAKLAAAAEAKTPEPEAGARAQGGDSLMILVLECAGAQLLSGGY